MENVIGQSTSIYSPLGNGCRNASHAEELYHRALAEFTLLCSYDPETIKRTHDLGQEYMRPSLRSMLIGIFL